jgi:hypothetical protein
LDFFKFAPAAVAEGFKIPDFKIDSTFTNLRDALRSREKHIDMLDLMNAMKEYQEITSTFGGEIPEYAFGEIQEPRLRIGEKYLVPDQSGKDVVAKLIDCCVSEREKLVYCVHKFEDGKTTIGSYLLTEKELAAYRKHPDTFFGVYKKQTKTARDPLDLFDFFFEAYKHTPKDRLLELLKGHPRWEELKNESQEELAITYCENTVYSAMNLQ